MLHWCEMVDLYNVYLNCINYCIFLIVVLILKKDNPIFTSPCFPAMQAACQVTKQQYKFYCYITYNTKSNMYCVGLSPAEAVSAVSPSWVSTAHSCANYVLGGTNTQAAQILPGQCSIKFESFMLFLTNFIRLNIFVPQLSHLKCHFRAIVSHSPPFPRWMGYLPVSMTTWHPTLQWWVPVSDSNWPEISLAGKNSWKHGHTSRSLPLTLPEMFIHPNFAFMAFFIG